MFLKILTCREKIPHMIILFQDTIYLLCMTIDHSLKLDKHVHKNATGQLKLNVHIHGNILFAEFYW